ncbi:MAG: MBL fold metallo-hydrolase [Pseudopedobacter saltans]|uniref:MBL fold metallo-hydrolase n=1 Tax=Pseudopedobacter saltans TaxID=151895 RepID=A0A2W5EQ51_9SPHI|nr:MAG: MBL fold metallo-hydrolase [Pseudopedobacter saltans]
MNRRNLLKNSLWAGLAVALPVNYSKAKVFEKIPTNKNGGFKKLKLGDLELTILTDGHILQKPIQPFMCPLAPEKELNSILKANFRSIDEVDMAMNVLLIKKGNQNILLDSGMGMFANSEDNHWLLQSLAEAGIKPESITEIFISHAHPDHIGGLVDHSQHLVFPNATVYISKTEYDFWRKATISDFSKSPLSKQPDFLNPIIKGIQLILKTVQPKLRFYPDNGLLFDTFQFALIPGHTPGMVSITVQSKNEKLVYIADLIHHDILLFQHPEWGYSGDTDLEIATETRKKTLAELSNSKIKVFAYHLPWPGLGFVGKENQQYKWFPEPFATI